ncbi:MAG: dihydroorotate dehydrogenase electron transfer subunit [Alphaproteobacteria bacterium]|uniref:Dihydroorotate dehydrogenase B (NAD(+)), electron transfer subunit n=1 Tax=Candidatus Nitrobium versatile TaxID=2884831 RepID=A0A953LVS2_9BACT|nr:dihydroorotate dehydrogenase electron transfer subunit [Candidatus Nitrobium versatile]
MHKYFNAAVDEHRFVSKHFKLLRLRPLSEAADPEPGQFYMLQAGDTSDPLLKRPFSIFTREDGTLSFLYRIRGKGTQSLARFRQGDCIRVIGPLGNRYPVPQGDFIAVAGGIGIASLLSLLGRYPGSAHLFYGARSAEELVMGEEAKRVAKEVVISTDDGSAGMRGTITDLLAVRLEMTTGPLLPLYACGPTPMLRELHRIVAKKGVRCDVSLEEHMACGVGACLGCVVKTTSGYRRVCKEGPVFDMEELAW